MYCSRGVAKRGSLESLVAANAGELMCVQNRSRGGLRDWLAQKLSMVNKAECTLLPSYRCTIPCNSIVSTLRLSCAVHQGHEEHGQHRHNLYIYVYSRSLPRPINGSVVLTRDKAQFFASFAPFPFCASSRDDQCASRERLRRNVGLPPINPFSFLQRANGEIKCYKWRLRL